MKQGERQQAPGAETANRAEPAAGTEEITRWLASDLAREPQVLETLLPVVYDELHRQAVRFFSRERPGHTLQPTALVSEVYLRLIGQQDVSWQNRAHFSPWRQR